MTDYFAQLGLPRRPGLDETALQENYLRLAAKWHPDAPLGDVGKFRDLQEARRILSDPAARLRHLLELEGYEGKGGAWHAAEELFLEVAGALESARGMQRKFADTRSLIGRASLEPERRRVEQRILCVAEQVAASRRETEDQLRNEDARWPESDFPLLEKISKNSVFLARWSNELRESLFRLENPGAP